MASRRPQEAPGAAQADPGASPVPGHENCRLMEFRHWNRVVLEHERAYLSRIMAGKAFFTETQYAELMHDLQDLDWFLSQLPKRVKTP